MLLCSLDGGFAGKTIFIHHFIKIEILINYVVVSQMRVGAADLRSFRRYRKISLGLHITKILGGPLDVPTAVLTI